MSSGAPGSASYLRPEVLSRLGGLELRARQVVEGFVSGMHRSPYRGYSVEFAEHREYVAGDDTRHLDWRVWGRVDRLYIKQYEEETNLRTQILVDCSKSMRYPEQREAGRMSKFEYAATLAASLAFLLTHQQDAVGLLLFDDQVRAELPALSSQAHLRALVSQLERAMLEHAGDSDVLTRDLPSKLRRRSIVVLISDLLMDTDALLQTLDRMRHERHEVIVMHVLDADEREFRFQHHTRFDGLEVATHVTVDPQSLRRAYLDELQKFLTRIRGECLNRQVDFVELTTTQPLDVALRSYLAMREHLRKR